MSSKRSVSSVFDVEHGNAKPKRLRVVGQRGHDEVDGILMALTEPDGASAERSSTTRHQLARRGIQRSIAMVLSHDGFASATPEALEGFTEMVETYLQSLIEEVKAVATASRRDHPIPLDFELMMRRYNLPLSSLRPHIKNPIPLHQLAPIFKDDDDDDDDIILRSLPLLGDELSGQADKDMKSYIPPSFPDFPSTHTYKFTPQEDTSSRNSMSIREEAARTAQQGEDALRRLVRASKMRKQKEVKLLVERDSQGRERFRMWESTMKRFMRSENEEESTNPVEIADHSMIVNGDAIFSRQEISRLSKRTTGIPSNNTSWDRSVP